MRFGNCKAGNNLSCSYSIDGKVLDFVTSHGDLCLGGFNYASMTI